MTLLCTGPLVHVYMQGYIFMWRPKLRQPHPYLPDGDVDEDHTRCFGEAFRRIATSIADIMIVFVPRDKNTQGGREKP